MVKSKSGGVLRELDFYILIEFFIEPKRSQVFDKSSPVKLGFSKSDFLKKQILGSTKIPEEQDPTAKALDTFINPCRYLWIAKYILLNTCERIVGKKTAQVIVSSPFSIVISDLFKSRIKFDFSSTGLFRHDNC